MTTKKNKSKGLPFKSGETTFTRNSRNDHMSSDLIETSVYKYMGEVEGKAVAMYRLSKIVGVGHHPQEITVDQEALLTEYKVQPQTLVKSRLAVDLSSYISRRVKLHKVDGCDASGVLIGVVSRSIESESSMIILPTMFRIDGLGLIPVKDVYKIEVYND